MTLEEALFRAFLGDSGVTGIVGSNIHASLLPRNEIFPALLYGRISTERTVRSGSYTLDQGYTGFFRARIQIDAESNDYDETVRLADAAKLVVARADFTGGGVSQANQVGDERDLNMPNQIAQFRRSFDALIWFQEQGRDA